jgi:hypothetical protein
MPLYYFHLVSPGGREIDEIGSPCLSVDHAMVEAWRAAVEISIELLRGGRPAGDRGFEVCDELGRPVFELAFSDVLGVRAKKPERTSREIRASVAMTLGRNQALRSELAVALANVRTSLATTRALLGS